MSCSQFGDEFQGANGVEHTLIEDHILQECLMCVRADASKLYEKAYTTRGQAGPNFRRYEVRANRQIVIERTTRPDLRESALGQEPSAPAPAESLQISASAPAPARNLSLQLEARRRRATVSDVNLRQMHRFWVFRNPRRATVATREGGKVVPMDRISCLLLEEREAAKMRMRVVCEIKLEAKAAMFDTDQESQILLIACVTRCAAFQLADNKETPRHRKGH
ncbi:hypothetical protein B0H14DRAFT_2578082 [Mycena olivaceomarginata]|nr:hypothetical protein B0H14DRAFT_2578082 [Mycena olivaceomarginata]